MIKLFTNSILNDNIRKKTKIEPRKHVTWVMDYTKLN